MRYNEFLAAAPRLKNKWLQRNTSMQPAPWLEVNGSEINYNLHDDENENDS